MTDDALFARALALVLQNEGTEYTNHPADRGGPTCCGITQNTLARYRNGPVTAADVANITRTEVEHLYRAVFWVPMRTLLYGGSDAGVALALMDASVLCGLPRVVRIVQRTVGVQVDGVPGPLTRRATAGLVGDFWLPTLVSELLHHFREVVAQNPGQVAFLNGWNARVSRYLKDTLIA